MRSSVHVISLAEDSKRLARILTGRQIAISAAVGYSSVGILSTLPLLVLAAGSLSQTSLWMILIGQALLFAIPTVAFLQIALALTSPSRRYSQLAKLCSIVLLVVSVPGLFGTLLTAITYPATWAVSLVAASLAAGSLFLYSFQGIFSLPKYDPSSRLIRAINLSGSSKHLLGLPAAIVYIDRENSAKAARIAILSVLAYATTCFLVLNLNGWLIAIARFNRLASCSATEDTKTCLMSNSLDPLLVTGTVLLGALEFSKLGMYLNHRAHALVRQSASELITADKRDPILFLRSFRTERMPFNKPARHFLKWIADAGRLPSNLDHLLLEEATQYGPVVAIGDPKSQTPNVGAARDYHDEATWQTAIAHWMTVARYVVIYYKSTPGVRWEVEQIVKQGALYKTLLLFPPDGLTAAELDELLEIIDLEPYDSGPSRTIGMHITGGVWQVMQCHEASYEAYKLAIHEHMQSMQDKNAASFNSGHCQ